MTKTTKTTFKSFIKKNRANLLIRVDSKFDGMSDMVERVKDDFGPIVETEAHLEHTLGIQGLWLVLGGGDRFRPYEKDGFVGIEVYNCCGSCVIAIRAEGEEDEQEAEIASMVRINAFTAFDNYQDHGTLDASIAAHRQNVVDTLGDWGIKGKDEEALALFDARVEELWNAETIINTTSKTVRAWASRHTDKILMVRMKAHHWAPDQYEVVLRKGWVFGWNGERQATNDTVKDVVELISLIEKEAPTVQEIQATAYIADSRQDYQYDIVVKVAGEPRILTTVYGYEAARRILINDEVMEIMIIGLCGTIGFTCHANHTRKVA